MTTAARTIRGAGHTLIVVTFVAMLVLPFVRGADTGFYFGTAAGPIRRPANHMRGMFVLDAAGVVRPRPHWRGNHTIDGGRHEVRLNNLGMRGRDLGVPDPGERRVLVTGDSFVWGYGVDEDQTFCVQLEAALRTGSNSSVTVGNAGEPGYGLKKQLATIHALKTTFVPDVVVACVFVGNDFDDDAVDQEAIVDGNMIRGPMARWVTSSWRAQLAMRYQLAFLVEQSIDLYAPRLASDRVLLAIPTPEEFEAAKLLPPPPQRGAGLFLDAEPMDATLETLLDGFSGTIASIRDAAAPAPLVVVVIPSWPQVAPTLYENTLRAMGFEPKGFVRGLAGQRLAERCAGLGIRTLDLFPLLDRAPDRQKNWLPIAQHLSPAGHRLVADALAPLVRELLDR